MQLFRLLITLIVSHVHPPFPPEFDLSTPYRARLQTHPSSPHCRIFTRPAFSQRGCGACAAFAVATAAAVRSCVRDGRDWIPSPHRLFDCGGGDCANGSVVDRVVGAMNRGVQDVDDEVGGAHVFGRPCVGVDGGGDSADADVPSDVQDYAPFRLGWPHWLAVYPIRHVDVQMLKTELYVFHNPLLVILDPDFEMSLYSQNTVSVFSDVYPHLFGAHRSSDSASLLDPRLPVYSITGARLHPHVMVVLGWGTAPEPHWIVQNSWGDQWGDRGRGRIAMGDISAAVVLDARVWREDWMVLIVGGALVVWLVCLEIMDQCWVAGVWCAVKEDGDKKKKDEEMV